MAKREVNTNLWIYDLLKEAKKDKFKAQGSTIKEINSALQTTYKGVQGQLASPR